MNPNPTFTANYSDGVILHIPHQTITLKTTYFAQDIISGSTSLSIINGSDFAVNDMVILGDFGTETSEIRKITTAGTNTLGTNILSFTHLVGEPIICVNYDQIEISYATSSTGTYTVLSTLNLSVTDSETTYLHSAGLPTYYYKIRLSNSGGVTPTYSNYSDAVNPNSLLGKYTDSSGITRYSFNSAGRIIQDVRTLVGNTNLPDDFFLTALNEARHIVDTQYGHGRSNEWRAKFEYPIQMLAGTNFINLPADVDFSESARSVFNVRYARQSVAANIPIRYIDKREWNIRAYFNRYSTTSSAVTSGTINLPLATTGDMPTSGTVFIATEDPTQSILTVSYTGNNLATNTLTGCSGITRNVSTNIQVWGTPVFTYAYFYTVFDGKIWFDKPVPQMAQGKNCFIDYYMKMYDLMSLSDTIPEHFRDCYKDYLKFAIKRRRDDSIGENDEDYKRFKNGITTVLGNPFTGQNIIIS